MLYCVRALLCVVCVTLAILITGCGGGSATTPTAINQGDTSPVVETTVTWPAGLPVDAAQPWEELDSDGRVSACLNADSEFLAGCEHFHDCTTGITDLDETVHIESGTPGSGLVAWVIYRVVMGGEQPGVVTTDVNPGVMSDGGLSEYYIGLSDYGGGCWEWHGPFTDNHVRISTGVDVRAGGDYLSELGNHFVCVVAYDGATVDVVGVATNSYDETDTEAPPVPAGLHAFPAYGALDIHWDDVLAGDLAGYRLYWSEADFAAPDEAGVNCVDYLIGQGSYLLTNLPATTIRVRVSAVDISGNESDLSSMASVLVYAGQGPALRLGVSAASGMINDAVTLTATGAVNYAWDLDGDGTYEVTGDTMGMQTADTGHTGVIRPSVRGTTDDDSCMACSAVSLVIASNSRPVANAYAAPTTGSAPLLCTLTGGGLDDDGQVALYAWDFDGDGMYDRTDSTDPGPVAHTYENPGLYNAKFRIEDDLGSWDVDTVSILVSPGANRAPSADLVIGAGEAVGDAPHSVHFDASGSYDPDGADDIVRYWWDLDGDGGYELMTDTAGYNFTYQSPGAFTARCKVEDADGDSSTDTAEITVNAVGNSLPVVDLTSNVTSGDAPLAVHFDATGSTDSDGTIMLYEWDYERDGIYDGYGTVPTADHTYTTAGVYDCRIRVTDDDGAQATDFVEITVSVAGNDDPVADLTSDVTGGDIPLTVSFDASGSTDSDGSIVRYEWDFDGNGNYDGYGSDPTIAHTYTSAGIYTARMRVTDDAGAQDTDTVEVTASVPGNADPVADITADVTSGSVPLTVNFDATGSTDGDGTIVLYEWDFERDGVYDGYGTDPTISHTYTASGNYNCRVRVTDDAGAQDVDAVLISVNAPPVADLYSVPIDDIEPGEPVWLNANGSSDSDGSIVDYEWDLDGDGTYNEAGAEADNQGDAIIEIDFTQGGAYPVRVRVSDDAGAQDSASLTVMVHGWYVTTVDATNDVGEYSSLVVVNSRPAIAYCDYTSGQLNYIRSIDDTGMEWGNIRTISDSGSYGMYCSLAVVNGQPAIAYQKQSSTTLKYVRAENVNGSMWGTPVAVDSDGSVGHHLCIQVVDGFPAISYKHAGDLTQMYIRATNANGSAWGTRSTVMSTGSTGWFSDLELVDGNPAIVCFESVDNDLWYCRADDTTGAGWGTPVAIETTGATGKHPDLAIVNGYPAVCFYHEGYGDLLYMRAADTTGTVWGAVQTLDSNGDVGNMPSMEVIGGRPAIFYRDVTNGNLRFIWAVDADGVTWDTPVTIDAGTDVGKNPSIAVVAGSPAVSYYDIGNTRLKYARLF